MAPPQHPTLFLSHSGEQKGFAWSLYRELRNVNHSTFFDQDSGLDSLPKASPFASRIVDACRACKLGIVVLSHEYIETMWPMLELQQLLFHNPSSPHNVFPIFYELKPVDLCKPENLTRWKSAWDRKAPVWHKRNRDRHMATPTTFQALTLDIDSWPEALERLRHQNGQIRPENKDDHTFIQAIVSDICTRQLPPQLFHIESYLKGAERIQQEIHDLFQAQQQQQQRHLVVGDAYRRPISVGLYGVGGSGKTTVCNYMLNFYSKEYPGSCCFLQFSSKEEDESQLLVRSMKDILSKHDNLATSILETIRSAQQAMPHVQEFLRRYKVFLILDNVWDWDVPVAMQIVTMDYMPGSKLLVTARSEALLRALLFNWALGGPPPRQIVHVPSISKEEATEALIAYSLTSSQYSSNGKDLRGLVKSCFFGKQCHPLLLKAVGAELRRLGGRCSPREWTQLCSRIQNRVKCGGEGIEGTVVNVLKTSYDGLRPRLQNTFLKLGTCVPGKYLIRGDESLLMSSEWLSMVSSASDSQTTDDIREQISELEYHGLLQIYKGKLVIHDLQMKLIQNIMQKNNGEPGCFFFEGDVATLSEIKWSRLKYIHGWSRLTEESFDQRGTSPNVSGIEVLRLVLRGVERCLPFSVQRMQSLRHLKLRGDGVEVVGGWHGAPNLVSVKLSEILRIESMTCLQRLERLKIVFAGVPFMERRSQNDCTIDGALPACSSLQELTVKGCTGLHKLSVSNWINLRKLKLHECERLQTIEGSSVCGFSTALEELSLEDCKSLESIPDLKEAGNLRILKLKGCKALKEVKVGDAVLTSLERLSLDYGRYNLVLSTPSCSPLPMAAFTNLRSLCADGQGWGSTGSEEVDVGSSINLPASLEDLALMGFNSGAAKEMIGLSTLVNLQRLFIGRCPSLTRVTGLGALTKLAFLRIWACESLREVGQWEDPFDTYELKHVEIMCCPRLETLSTFRYLPSLTRIEIHGCPNVQEDMLPQAEERWLDGKEV